MQYALNPNVQLSLGFYMCVCVCGLLYFPRSQLELLGGETVLQSTVVTVTCYESDATVIRYWGCTEA